MLLFTFCIILSLSNAITPAVDTTEINPRSIVACCTTSPCTLDLEVSEQAVVNWTNTLTGAAPECLATGLCHANRSGLHFLPQFSNDGYYTATITEWNYTGTEIYYLMFLPNMCETLVESADVEVPVTRAIETMPLTTITVNGTLFQPITLPVPPEKSDNIRNVRWYKVTDEFRATKVSRVRSKGRRENVQPHLAIADLAGDLLVLHVSPQTIGLWLLIIQHPGGRCDFVKYNITVPDWQQSLVEAFTAKTATLEEQDPIDFKNKYTWSLYSKKDSGMFKVICNVTSAFPNCLDDIDQSNQYVLMGESKKTINVMILTFFPVESTLMYSTGVQENLSVQNAVETSSYVLLAFFLVGVLCTLVILVAMCCCITNRFTPVYVKAHQ
ncbi:E3 [Bat mastadenovirus]|uniref:E3 n=1 Tax=Bat mastadenovirus TaxID=740971 RepID=A0A3G9ETA8_9ADEN|nr:E3 [Bat mastadenovirus]BBE29320.1 E3 [Bat mastadenovirus]